MFFVVVHARQIVLMGLPSRKFKYMLFGQFSLKIDFLNIRGFEEIRLDYSLYLFVFGELVSPDAFR